MKSFIWLTILVFLSSMSGCATRQQDSARKVNQENLEDLRTVAGAMAGKTLTDEDLKKLDKQLKTDKDAQSAVSTLTNSLSGTKKIIKYCPVCGERFAASVKTCPTHNVELKQLGQQ